MQHQDNNVIKLPTELCELREAKKLVNEWGQIQTAPRCERIIAMVDWRRRMERHLALFMSA